MQIVSEATENAIAGEFLEEAFEKLLRTLDPNIQRAGEIYVELRFRLRKFFAWKGGVSESDLDELVDETLDRITKKIGEGEVIENINAYARGVARNVLFEYLRKRTTEPIGEVMVEALITEHPERADERYECLKKCLANLHPDDHEQILGYYDTEENEKNKDKRRRLAERFGKRGGTLKVHVTRLRERLRKCISECMRGER